MSKTVIAGIVVPGGRGDAFGMGDADGDVRSLGGTVQIVVNSQAGWYLKFRSFQRREQEYTDSHALDISCGAHVKKFAFEISATPRGTVVTVHGDIGMLETGSFDRELKTVIAARPGLVAMDLSNVGMLGSSAMGMLVAFRREISKGGGKVRLAAVHPLVLEALKRALFHRLFEFYDTVDSALAAPVATA